MHTKHVIVASYRETYCRVDCVSRDPLLNVSLHNKTEPELQTINQSKWLVKKYLVYTQRFSKSISSPFFLLFLPVSR